VTQQPAIRRGEVYLVAYTFPHEQTAKERPVLILQTDLDNANDRYPLVLAGPITTQKTEHIYEQDVFLPAGEANLKQDSKVMLGLTQPFPKAHLGRRLGHVSNSRMRLVEIKLLRLFGFVSPRSRS
jgi:mRNA-degrading endonuclease toxin of MazEF toxin-antitoxin module